MKTQPINPAKKAQVFRHAVAHNLATLAVRDPCAKTIRQDNVLLRVQHQNMPHVVVDQVAQLQGPITIRVVAAKYFYFYTGHYN